MYLLVILNITQIFAKIAFKKKFKNAFKNVFKNAFKKAYKNTASGEEEVVVTFLYDWFKAESYIVCIVDHFGPQQIIGPVVTIATVLANILGGDVPPNP